MRWLAHIALVAITLIWNAPLQDADAQSRPTVQEIIVEGNQRIETGTIRSYLLIQEGDPIDLRRIDQSLKSLFATGLFADVSINRQANALLINVVENPLINRIAFEGNKRLEDAFLKSEITLKPRVVFTQSKIQSDVKRILDVYRVNGRFGATVDPKVIQLPQNRADLVFEIDEGPLTSVGSIRFIGNRVFDDDDLRDVILTREKVWYNFLTSNDTYDSDRITFDRELLRRFYLSEGYADFRVDSANAEMTPDRSAFFVTFKVTEGKQYKFAKPSINIGLRDLKISQLSPFLDFEEGDVYDNRLVEKSVREINNEIGKLGFPFVDVRPKIKRDTAKQEILVTIEVRDGPREFVERIDIVGNVRTMDSVIRREFKLVEGDAFNASKIRRSRQRIRDLDFFNKVVLEREPGSTPDKTIVKVEVEEKSTGSLNLGLGYSTDAGPLVDVTLRERNLLGKGQSLSLSTTLAAEKSSINMSVTEPFFLNRDIAAGFDLFHVARDLQGTRSYNTANTGFGLRAGYPLSELLRQSWSYRLDYSEIKDVASTASQLIKTQEGERYLSQVGHVLSYDARDSKITPTEGFAARLNNDLAGLGGDVFYLRNVASAAQFYALAPGWVLSASGKTGHILGLGEDVEIADRFFLGGNNLRGFASAGAGPRDKSSKDSLGGEWIYHGGIELTMPLGLPDELGINGRLFTDVGSLFTVSPSSSNVVDSASPRASVGAGVGWVSPFGPINVDLGWAFLKEDLDETEVFRLNFGTRF